MTLSIDSCDHIFIIFFLVILFSFSCLPCAEVSREMEHSYFQMSVTTISFFLDRVSILACPSSQGNPVHYCGETIDGLGSCTGQVVLPRWGSKLNIQLFCWIWATNKGELRGFTLAPFLPFFASEIESWLGLPWPVLIALTNLNDQKLGMEWPWVHSIQRWPTSSLMIGFVTNSCRL